jgi:hypothetical protein
MAVTTKWYGNGLLKVCTGAIDLDTDTFKVMLTTSSYTPDQDTHDFANDVTNEVTGTGYTAGGNTLGSVSVTYDAASNEVRILWADSSWTTSTITARYAVIYKSRGGLSSADELVGYIDFGADVSSTAGTFTLDFTTSVLKITAS